MLFEKHKFGCLAWLLALTLTLAGCGGGGGGAGAIGRAAPASSSAGGSTPAAKVKVVADAAVLSSDGKTPVNVSAIVTDANNLAVSGATVTFVVQDPSSGTKLQVTQAKTDATGTATAILSLLSGYPINRPVVVTAQIGTEVTDTLTIKVSGTALAVSGPNALLFTGPAAAFTATLRDSSGNPIAGQAMTIKSAVGNRLSSPRVETDASGQATVNVSGTVAGNDTLTFEASGTSATAQINVAGDNLIMSPMSASAANGTPITAKAEFTVSYVKAGGIPAGTTVALATTRGKIAPSHADITSGTATFTVESSFAGPATVTASVGGVAATYNMNFVAETPHGVDLQTSPSSIGPNADGSTTNRSVLVATVRDAQGNPVANRDVSFNAISDPSGGTISPGVARTDFSGRATVAFMAGPQTTATNGVHIQATDVGSGKTSQEALLTVSTQALYVRLGTNRTLDTSVSDATYRKNFDLMVTDATGNAVTNAAVQAQVRPIGYMIGKYKAVGSSWVATYRSYEGSDFTGSSVATDTAAAAAALNNSRIVFDDGWDYEFDGVKKPGLPYYPSEDLDNNGVCKVGEDVNYDGQLTPGNVASVPTTVTTDEYGRATVGLVYPRSFANWVIVRVEVTIRVNGSEGTAGFTYPLIALNTDLDTTADPPGGRISPFPFKTDRRTCP